MAADHRCLVVPAPSTGRAPISARSSRRWASPRCSCRRWPASSPTNGSTPRSLYGLFQIAGAIVLFIVPLIDNPAIAVLGDAAQHVLLHADDLAGDHGGLQRAQARRRLTWSPCIRRSAYGARSASSPPLDGEPAQLETSAAQFHVAAGASLLLGLYAFTLPECPPQLVPRTAAAWPIAGADLVRAVQGSQHGGVLHLRHAARCRVAADQCLWRHLPARLRQVAAYKDLLTVRYPAIIISISQILRDAFILAIPFFLKRFGIKAVMTMSMLAWVLRFGLFAYGNPAGGLWMIVLSCIVYGMAFDFFNISGSAVRREPEPTRRSAPARRACSC